MFYFLKEYLQEEKVDLIPFISKLELFYHFVERCEKGMENVVLVIEKQELSNKFNLR